MKNRYRRFSELSKTRRSVAGFKLRQQMMRYRDLYGGRFTSHLLLHEPEEPIICNQWFDFVFTGPHKYDVWNASIVTAREDFWFKVESLAFDRAWDLLSPEEQEGKIDINFIAHKPEYPQFGGLTFRDYCQQAERDIIAGEPPEIYECFKLDRSYGYGVGLHIVVDAEAINYPLIDRTIDRFLSLGQKSWKNDKPVPRERLPFESQDDAIKAGRALLPSLYVRSQS